MPMPSHLTSSSAFPPAAPQPPYATVGDLAGMIISAHESGLSQVGTTLLGHIGRDLAGLSADLDRELWRRGKSLVVVGITAATNGPNTDLWFYVDVPH